MEGHASINSITLTTWKLEDLPTHQVFSTNEPREGRVKTTASPAAPAQRHPSRHLIEHPVQVTSKERKSRETAERDESGPRACDGAAREARPPGGLSNQGSDTSALRSRRFRPWQGLTPCPKNELSPHAFCPRRPWQPPAI